MSIDWKKRQKAKSTLRQFCATCDHTYEEHKAFKCAMEGCDCKEYIPSMHTGNEPGSYVILSYPNEVEITLQVQEMYLGKD